jgi:hypothetical protein
MLCATKECNTMQKFKQPISSRTNFTYDMIHSCIRKWMVKQMRIKNKIWPCLAN